MATKHMRWLWLGLAGLLSAPVLAADGEAKPPLVVGAASEAVLAKQRQGDAAGALQPVSGEVATRSYKRYLDSFSKAMPEFNETIGSTGQSGGGANP